MFENNNANITGGGMKIVVSNKVSIIDFTARYNKAIEETGGIDFSLVDNLYLKNGLL